MEITRATESKTQGQETGSARRPDAAGEKFVSSLSKGSVFKGTVRGRQAGLDIIDAGGTLLRTRSEVPLPENATVSLEVTETGNPVKVRLLSVLGQGEEERGRAVARLLRQMMGVRSGLAGLDARIAGAADALAGAGRTENGLAQLLSIISQGEVPEPLRNAAVAGLFQPAGQEGGIILKQLVAALARAVCGSAGEASVRDHNVSGSLGGQADAANLPGRDGGLAGSSSGVAARPNSGAFGTDDMIQGGGPRSDKGIPAPQFASGSPAGPEDNAPASDYTRGMRQWAGSSRRDAGAVMNGDNYPGSQQGGRAGKGAAREAAVMPGKVVGGDGGAPYNSAGPKISGAPAGEFVTCGGSRGPATRVSGAAGTVSGAAAGGDADKPGPEAAGRAARDGSTGAAKGDGPQKHIAQAADNGQKQALNPDKGPGAPSGNSGPVATGRGEEKAVSGSFREQVNASGPREAARGETGSAPVKAPAGRGGVVQTEGAAGAEKGSNAEVSARLAGPGPSMREAVETAAGRAGMYTHAAQDTGQYDAAGSPASKHGAAVSRHMAKAPEGAETAPHDTGAGVKKQLVERAGLSPFVQGRVEEKKAGAGRPQADARGVLPGEKPAENESRVANRAAAERSGDIAESGRTAGQGHPREAGRALGGQPGRGDIDPRLPGEHPDVHSGREAPRNQGHDSSVARLLTAISTHADAVGQYQQHVQDFLNIPFLMFPILFEKGQGHGHWSWWRDEEPREAGAEAAEHIAFDLELTVLGRVNIQVLRQGVDITLQASASRDVLPMLRAGMQELRERLEMAGFGFTISDIFPIEDADGAGVMTPFGTGGAPGGSSMNIVA